MRDVTTIAKTHGEFKKVIKKEQDDFVKTTLQWLGMPFQNLALIDRKLRSTFEW